MKKLIEKVFSIQGIRFLFVGGLNTLVGYGIYALLVYLNVNYLVANTISTIIGVAHSYLWNRYFTFKSKQKALKEITKFVSVYIASYLIGMCTLFIFKDKLNISPYIAGLINLVITTLISYFGHKYISFKDGSMNTKKIVNYFKEIIEPGKIEWILFLIIFTVSFLIFKFPDIDTTTTNGIHFIDLLLKGEPYKLYEVAYKGGTMITYDFPIFIIFGIWNFPLLIYQNITHLDWNSTFFGILWAKIILIPFLFGSAYFLNKISEFLIEKSEDRKLLKYLFLTSPLLIMTICQFAGYDIISVFFTLIGIYYYLKNDTKKFILFFSIAITLKLFALFIFLPLMLLKEKNIIKIGLYHFFAILPFAIAKSIYYNAPYYKISMDSFNEGMFNRLIYSSIPLQDVGAVSIFFVFYILVCVICYILSKNYYKKYCITICFIVYSIFELFVLQHPQWYIINVPYLAIIIVNDHKYINIKLLFETIYEISVLSIYYISFTHVFNPRILMNDMLIGVLTNHTSNYTFKNLIEANHISNLLPIFSSISIVCIILIIYLTFNDNKKIEDKKVINRGLVWLRTFSIIPFMLVIIISFFVK